MQPNVKLASDATTAANGASTWSGTSVTQTSATFITRGTATDLDVVTVLSGSASSAAAGVAGLITVQLYGSAATGFATSTAIVADKGTTATAGTATWVTSAHYAQLGFPYYKLTYAPSATVTGQAVSVFILTGLQDSLDNTTN